MMGLKNTWSKDPLVQNILSLIEHISQNKKQISFIWEIGHLGKPGHEARDKAARNPAE